MFKDSTEAFPQFRWTKEQEIVFRPNIADATQSYMMSFHFRHVHGFQPIELPIELVIKAPSGASSTRSYTIPLRDERGDYLASCALDICDLETVVESSMEFPEPGEYAIHITHGLPVDPLPNVMEVGITIELAAEAGED